MKVHYLTSLFLLVFSSQLWAQNITLTGKISDKDNNEPLVGANIVVRGTTRGTVTDIDGNYTLTFDRKGDYELVVSYVGYETLETPLSISGNLTQDFALSSSIVMKEIVVTADIAIDRKTPVAFSNIPTAQIKEELASRDLPMLMQSIPGTYATQAGGGDGDARISLRGFDQRNVAVMLDGIPVNDMENGQVYWSNWFGLNQVTKQMQVQRGLGASKLAIPSVGGTINIITKGMESKPSFEFKQDFGAGGMFQSSLGFTSGKLKGNWAMSGAVAFRQNEGLVDQLWSKAQFYYFRLDKQLGKHLFTLSGFGGPQQHAQRPFSVPIAITDANFARSLGVRDSLIEVQGRGRKVDRGLRYNDAWGYLNGKPKTVRLNYYHKPQFNFRHSWNISPKTFLSNIAYLSIGNGGGTTINTINVQTDYDSTGQLNLDRIAISNRGQFVSNPNYIRTNVNNHFWYGLLSTFRHEAAKNLNFSGGIDLRHYTGEHYRTAYDLLDAKFFSINRNARIDPFSKLQPGDRVFNDYTGTVRWGGVFGLAEYTKNNWTAFLNMSGAMSQYHWEDRMYHKVVDINGKKLYTAYVDSFSSNHLSKLAIDNGVLYTIDQPTGWMRRYAQQNNLRLDSTTAQNQSIGWLNFPSYTLKTGFNYRFNRQHSAFANVGYLSRAPRFVNSIYQYYRGDFGVVRKYENIENELIRAIELGYQFRSPNFSMNINAYYTNWKNKPVDTPFSVLEDPSNPQSGINITINGIDALHQGIELDWAWQIMDKLKLEGIASVGDWTWKDTATYIRPADGSLVKINPDGVKVGDAAQLQLGGSVRFEPIKNAYISARGTWFGNNYSDFEPESLSGARALLPISQRQSWKMPSYFIMDAHVGYSIVQKKGGRINLRASLLNVLNTQFISDARNNDTLGTGTSEVKNDAGSATVFFGLPRRWTASVEFEF
jgi:iron complex outermembrane recepter protein